MSELLEGEEAMIFNISKASDWEYSNTKDFNSIEEMRDFVKKEYTGGFEPACVLYFPEQSTPVLQIYDTWIE